MFLVVSVVFAFLVNKIYIYQTESTFDAFRRGQFWNMIKYGIPYAFFYTVIFSFKLVFRRICTLFV